MEQVRRDRLAEIEKNGGDAGMLLDYLTELEEKNPGWKHASTVRDGRLVGLVWMSPLQQELGRLWGDVVQVDASEGRNLYDFYLTTFVLIDGEGKSRNMAYALHAEQDAPTFSWINRFVNRTLSTVGFPHVVLRDRAGAIALGVSEIWPNAFQIECFWHIISNIKQNLTKKMGTGYAAFYRDFIQMYRMGSETSFRRAWETLRLRWPHAMPYLEGPHNGLWHSRESWAWYSVGKHFAAGCTTTSRVEVEHKVYKSLGLDRRYYVALYSSLTNRTSFNDLFDRLHDRQEDQRDRHLLLKHQASRIRHWKSKELDSHFQPLLEEARQFLTLHAYSSLYNECRASLVLHEISEVRDIELSQWKDGDEDEEECLQEPQPMYVDPIDLDYNEVCF